MGMLRDSLTATLENGRLFLLSIIVFILEGLVRFGLAWELSWLLVVLWPPVIAVVAFGLAGGTRRGKLFGTRSVRSTAEWSRLAGRLGAVALLGQVIALAAGGSVFLIVDTSLRAVLYAAGFELLQSEFVGVWLPYLGLLAGTAVVWPLPAVAAVHVIDGLSVTAAFKRSLNAFLGQARLFATCSLMTVIAALSPFGMLWASILLIVALPSSGTLTVFFVVLVSLLVACGGIVLSMAAMTVLLTGQQFRIESVASARQQDSVRISVPVGRILVACVLVVSLATVAGAARITETRPTDTSVEPLGEEPNEIYQTAVQNTLSQSHTVVQYPRGQDENYTIRRVFDLAEREYAITPDPYGSNYATVGIQRHNSDSFALAFLRLGRDSDARTPGIDPAYITGFRAGEALPGVQSNGSWTRLEEDDQIVLESTDLSTVLQETVYQSNVQETREAWIRATIDPDAQTLRSVEWSFNVTVVRDDGESDIATGHERIEFETGATIDRSEYTALSLRQRAWKLLIY